jgi:hypothetical protein
MVMLVQESIILKTTIRRKKIVSVTLATKLSKLSNGLWLGVCYFALQTFQPGDKIHRQNNSTNRC